MRPLALVAILCSPLAVNAAAQPGTRPAVHVLVIGSEHYAQPVEDGLSGFGSIPDVGAGAADVAELFQRRGARSTRLLRSDGDTLVSREDVMRAVDATITSARRDRRALLVVYFVGHGVSEGFGWLHFSVPGTLVFRGPLEDLAKAPGFDRHAIATTEFADRLRRSGLPFVLILDNCRQGTERDLGGVDKVLGTQGAALAEAASAAVRDIAALGGRDPVLFSTRPGGVVLSEANPLPGRDQESMGPLARRLFLTLAARRRDGSLTVGDLVRSLTSPTLDFSTGPAATAARPDPLWDWRLLGRGPPGPMVVVVPATGSSPDACCMAASPPTRVRLRGSVRITSAPSEHWLLDGGPRQMATPDAVLAAEVSRGSLSIEAERGPGRWALTLAAPEGGLLAPGRYDGAVRAPFQDAGRPGLSFETAGRACNEVQGTFEIRILEVQYGRLRHLEADARLRCDHLPGEVAVEVRAVGDR